MGVCLGLVLGVHFLPLRCSFSSISGRKRTKRTPHKRGKCAKSDRGARLKSYTSDFSQSLPSYVSPHSKTTYILTKNELETNFVIYEYRGRRKHRPLRLNNIASFHQKDITAGECVKLSCTLARRGRFLRRRGCRKRADRRSLSRARPSPP